MAGQPPQGHRPMPPQGMPPQGGVSDKDWLTITLVCFFVGSLGIHRFMVGKVGSGVAMLLTAGGCGIWTLVDFIMILMGKFTDAEGRIVKQKN